MASKKQTLAELAEHFNCKLYGNKDVLIYHVNSLENAKEGDLSFFSNPRYASASYTEALKESKASAFCISSEISLEKDKNYLISEDPSLTFQKIAEHFLDSETETAFTGIHETAVIHKSAKIAPNVTIGPYSVIDKDVTIGEKTDIASHVTIGASVEIGKNCKIYSHCTIREKCKIKNHVILQPGCVIGSCGFGYITDKTGKHKKLVQLGIVILEDDVEIGANTTIDRARFEATLIRKGTKIDNLVQIAHNVEIGEDNIIAGQVGIAGSSKTGKRVILGGQVGVSGHVEIEDNVLIAAQSGVSKSLKSGKYRGAPAIDIIQYNKQQAYIRKLSKYIERLQVLSQKFEDLESKISKVSSK